MQSDKYLKTYNAATGELSSTIYTTTQAKNKPKGIDCTDKYIFFIEQSNERVHRVNIESGAVDVINDNMHEVYMCYSLQVIQPKHYPNGLLILSTGFIGIHLIDCETLQRIYYFRDADDQFYQQCYVPITMKVMIASQKGVVKAIDISDIDKLKNMPDECI